MAPKMPGRKYDLATNFDAAFAERFFAQVFAQHHRNGRIEAQAFAKHIAGERHFRQVFMGEITLSTGRLRLCGDAGLGRLIERK